MQSFFGQAVSKRHLTEHSHRDSTYQLLWCPRINPAPQYLGHEPMRAEEDVRVKVLRPNAQQNLETPTFPMRQLNTRFSTISR